MMDSLLAGVLKGNTMEFASDNGQDTQPRKKEEAGRLQRRVRALKGNLTQSISSCIDRIKYYKTKYPTDDDTETSTVKIDDARGILDSLNRANDRYTKLEKILEELGILVADTWENEENELDDALEKIASDHVTYETKYLKMTRDHDDTIERCKSVLSASIPKNVTNKNRTTGGGNQTAPPGNCFKPQSDLKPAYLARDCTLPEFITFTKTFIIYMNNIRLL